MFSLGQKVVSFISSISQIPYSLYVGLQSLPYNALDHLTRQVVPCTVCPARTGLEHER